MSLFQTLRARFKKLTKKKKILLLLLLGLVAIFSLAVGFYLGLNGNFGRILSPIGTLLENKPPEPRDFPNPINGVLYTKSEAAKWKDRLPLAVVLENHTDARPQSGLSKADAVYEVLAEGGITRFLALYLAEDSILGPVRSNRTYFLDWLSEYRAGYAHIGGSPEAQARVKEFNISDLDQFFLGAPTYTRIANRFAPHNVYTTTDKLRGAADSRGYRGPVKLESWLFKDEESSASARPKKFELTLKFRENAPYVVDWKYNREKNLYLRFNGGASHIDKETNSQLSAKTIIVQEVIITPDPSGHSRIRIKTVGSGPVRIFQDGKVISGKWKKTSRTGRTRFFDNKGAEIAFNRGQIWIEIIPAGSPVIIKKN